MKTTKLNYISIKNFKGVASYDYRFADKTEIVADVMQGKSTIKDAYFFALGMEIENFFPLDKNNKPIEGLETFVELGLNVDGLTYVVSRGAKLKYKVNRETNERTFDGYKKDIYEFDRVPCTATDYKNKILALLGVSDYDIFKTACVLNFFNEQLSWKDRRGIIYNLFADKQAIDELKNSDKYNLLSNELKKDKSSADINTMLNAENNALVDRKRKNEILIAENKAKLSEYSFDENLDYEEELANLEEQIQNESARLSNLNVNEEKAKLEKQISELNLERMELESNDNDRKKELLSRVSNLEFKSFHIKDIGKMAEYKISTNTQKYKALKETTFDVGTTICPTCGQSYPQSHIESVKAKWEEERQNSLDEHKAEVLKYKQQYEEYKSNYANTLAQLEIAKAELDCFKPNPRIEEIKAKVIQLVSSAPTETFAKDNSKLKSLIKTKYELIESLGVKKAYIGCTNRIQELLEEQKDLVNAEITLAKKRAQLEQYTIDIINLINDSINKNFVGVEFKLFEVLTTSAKKDIKETFVVIHNGVDYVSQSTGEKANTNCIIVSTLQKALGINTPIWLDDASVLNLTNEPSNQLIYLLNAKGARLNYSRIRDLY